MHWKSVEAGARKAGEEFGAEILWKGPLKESDRAQQIAIVEQFVSEGVKGIVLAPLDDTALRRPVQAANAKGIPVVIIDSALKGEAGKDFVSYVGTNNRLGGKMAGEQLVKLLGGKGKVVLLRYQEGSASTTEREEGFLEAMKKSPEIQMLVENRYGGATASEAQTTALNMHRSDSRGRRHLLLQRIADLRNAARASAEQPHRAKRSSSDSTPRRRWWTR